MTSKFKHGDTVYTDDARECVYVAPAHDGHIVRAVLDCDDEGPDLGPPEVHFSVSASPPNDRYSAEVADAKAKLDAMRTEISTARQELATLTSGREAALKALASHPQLAPVVEYIEGKLTHAAVFGVYGTGIRIMTIEDAVTPGEHSEQKKGFFRLLSLYGGKHGPSGPGRSSYDDNLTWRISRYSDGSGSESEMCILGPSEGVVLERLQAFLNANWDRRGVWGEHKIESWAASAIKLGLHVPAALSEKVAENDEKSRLGKIERARNSLQEARNRLVMAERDLNAAEQFAIS